MKAPTIEAVAHLINLLPSEELTDAWFWTEDFDCHIYHGETVYGNGDSFVVEVYKLEDYTDPVAVYSFEELEVML